MAPQEDLRGASAWMGEGWGPRGGGEGGDERRHRSRVGPPSFPFRRPLLHSLGSAPFPVILELSPSLCSAKSTEHLLYRALAWRHQVAVPSLCEAREPRPPSPVLGEPQEGWR